MLLGPRRFGCLWVGQVGAGSLSLRRRGPGLGAPVGGPSAAVAAVGPAAHSLQRVGEFAPGGGLVTWSVGICGPQVSCLLLMVRFFGWMLQFIHTCKCLQPSRTQMDDQNHFLCLFLLPFCRYCHIFLVIYWHTYTSYTCVKPINVTYEVRA